MKSGNINFIDTELTNEQFTSLGYPALYILKNSSNTVTKFIIFDLNGIRTDYDTSSGGGTGVTEEWVNEQISTAIVGLQDNRLEFNEFSDFPAIGDETKFYIDLTEDKIYIWNATSSTYKNQSWDTAIIASIQASIASAQMAFQNLENSKQNKLTEDNVGEFMDLELPTKLIPTSGDTVLGRDSLTGKAVEIPASSFIDNLQIGGRNLLKNSKNKPSIQGVGSSIQLANGFKVINSNSYNLFGGISLEVGQQYTFSIKIRKLTPINGFIEYYINSDNPYIPFVTDSEITDTFKVFSHTRTIAVNGEGSFYMIFPSGELEIEYLKLEKGNKATDWTPSPEDKQDRLQNISGSIGIGKPDASATEKLDVNGNIKATGFITPNGTANQSLTANGGVFDLDAKADLDGGKVPAWQLPSYVDDVLEFANLASFPATGESGKIYIAIDTNLTYRWGGSSYVVMSSSLALGETSSTAYRGDRGKIAYDHSQATGNPHNTKVEELSDVGTETTYIADTDVILKKESGGFWKKITFANFKNWFTTELAKKINIGLDTVFNFKNISAMTLTQFKALTPNLETIYFTEEQNATGWQQIKYNGLGISIPATTETLVTLTNENYLELDSDSTFNLIDVANTKINGIFERDFVIIKFNAGVVTPTTANQWFKVILKINGVQVAVSPVFYLTETSGTVEQIAHNFSLNVPAEMVTNGATLHLKTSVAMTFNNPAISVVRVHKSTNANL